MRMAERLAFKARATNTQSVTKRWTRTLGKGTHAGWRGRRVPRVPVTVGIDF